MSAFAITLLAVLFLLALSIGAVAGAIAARRRSAALALTLDALRASMAAHEQRVVVDAHRDALTGLPNRLRFRDAVKQAIDTVSVPGGDGRVAVILLDIDRFKHVNEVLGHRFGDLLLQAVAQRLGHGLLRGGDLLARLGGNTFGVLLQSADAALAQQVARRLAQAFARPITIDEQPLDIQAGIGAACWPQDANDADTLIGRAEAALQAAKRRKAGPLLYDPTPDAASAQTRSLLADLRHAIDRGELRLDLQPQLELDGGRVVGAEGLVRWQHPHFGLVPPLQFIPIAEQTSFIRVLTLWVFEEAARSWQRLHEGGLQIVISVNLSARDLLDPALPQKFDALLLRHGVPAEGFCLEVTERAIMDDPQRALATLTALSALGFKLAIDDFGSGHSSLAQLAQLPVDELKIDTSFVKAMETDPGAAKVVRASIELAHNLGLTALAEGVETARSWEILRTLSCDLAQGYHLGKPMPHDDFARWSLGWASRHHSASERAALVLH